MSQYDAYRRNLNTTQSPREVEYRLLAQVTAALMEAQADLRNLPRKIDAVNWNKQVWDAFMVDVNDPENRLPRELRAAIISLAIWVTKETSLVIDERADLDALISVNKDIMKGLEPRRTAVAEARPTDSTA